MMMMMIGIRNFKKYIFFSNNNCFYKVIYILRQTAMYKVKLATIIEGNPKAPFLIATTPRGRRGRYSFSWIAPLYP